MGSLIRLEDAYGDSIEVAELNGGVVEISIDVCCGDAAVDLTPEQAEHLERTLYMIRVKRPFNERKEPDADGEPGPGPELEGRTPTPPHP